MLDFKSRRLTKVVNELFQKRMVWENSSLFFVGTILNQTLRTS
jgi:hypothetical protein